MLIWMDLETTGLHADEAVILEVACIVTENDFTEVDRFEAVCNHEIVMDDVDNYVLEMHSKSGLWDAVAESTLSQEIVGGQLLEFIQEYVGNRFAPLCGSSVHFDRKFLEYHWRPVYDWLHYRNIDVSTVKEIVRRLYGEEALYEGQKDKRHRAADDIQHSIDELRFYTERYFKKP